jgi:hypothetical protein
LTSPPDPNVGAAEQAEGLEQPKHEQHDNDDPSFATQF